MWNSWSNSDVALDVMFRGGVFPRLCHRCVGYCLSLQGRVTRQKTVIFMLHVRPVSQTYRSSVVIMICVTVAERL
jgi:hypothetical protein